MKKSVIIAIVTAFAAPAFAQGEQSDIRLAKLETIVITAEKAQPPEYKVDAKTAALLAEISKEKK